MERAAYRDIAPYVGQDVLDAIARIKAYPQFLENMAEVLFTGNILQRTLKNHKMKELIPPLLDQVTSFDDFQRLITAGVFLPIIEQNSMTSFTFSGIDQLDPEQAYLFVSNHRDIVLDCALLDWALFQCGHASCEMAIGDNLLVNQFTTDMFKLNGGVTVKRSLPMREMYAELHRFSEYVYYLQSKEKRSFWVAQRSGRAKDGLDNTSESIIKMFHLALKKRKKPFSELSKTYQIVPVAISYQYDPNDINKGREEVYRKLHGTYSKKKYEDLVNMLRGLRRYKGGVHITVGTPLTGTYKNAEEMVAALDHDIHSSYRLWDTNYFAYDYIHEQQEFVAHYQDLNTVKFLNRYKDLSPEVRSFVLTTYANPVASQLRALKAQ